MAATKINSRMIKGRIIFNMIAQDIYPPDGIYWVLDTVGHLSQSDTSPCGTHPPAGHIPVGRMSDIILRPVWICRVATGYAGRSLRLFQKIV